MSFVSAAAAEGFARGMQQVCAVLPDTGADYLHLQESAGRGDAAAAVAAAAVAAAAAPGPAINLPPALAVAYSGGLDSTVLLHLAHAWASRHSLPLFAFHIHHGLSPHADEWLAHCQQNAQALGVPFFFEHVVLAQAGNIEAQARKMRYAALGRLCRQHGVPLLLTAHHQDDQAETVLLKLLRGALVGKGMELLTRAPDLTGSDQVLIGRPLLATPRPGILDFAREHQLAHVHDESNLSPKYARSALRAQVMPVLATHFPGFQQVLARSSLHAQETAGLLDELGQQDLARYRQNDAATAVPGLQLAALSDLSQSRALNLLRYWLASHGARLPSSSWLHELYAQLRTARDDAQVCVVHPDCEIHRYRGCIQLAAKWQPAATAQRFQWQGETVLSFAAFGGQLQFIPAAAGEAGIGAIWLRQQTLELDYRQGGERIKLGPNRPHRSLKQHYQTFNIPAWQRTRLPLVHVSGERPGLLYAAGLGCASEYCGQSAQSVRLVWHMYMT